MILLLALCAQAEEFRLDVAPTAVTVYADRARVIRRTSLAVAAGRHQFVFEGLPSSTDTRSINAVVAAGQLAGLDVRRVTSVEAADVRVAEISEELQALGDGRVDVSDRITSLDQRISGLALARVAAAEALSAQLLVADRAPARARELRAALSDDEQAARALHRAATVELRQLDEQIGVLKRERGSLGSSLPDTHSAVVHVDVARAGKVTVDLAYIIPGASWRPRYDLRASGDTSRVALGLSAMVSQRTGEDWGDVELTVSSAQPGRGTTVPQLDPFWLSPMRERRAKRMVLDEMAI